MMRLEGKSKTLKISFRHVSNRDYLKQIEVYDGINF
jgi:hypothetical protein